MSLKLKLLSLYISWLIYVAWLWAYPKQSLAMAFERLDNIIDPNISSTGQVASTLTKTEVQTKFIYT